MTLRQRNMVRVYLGVKDKNVLSDDDIDVFIDQATSQDYSSEDDYCIALLACSLIAQSAKWLEITRQVDGLSVMTADTFRKMLDERLVYLGENIGLISQEDYDD